MTQPMRQSAGGRIDRSQVIRFTFDGRAFDGHPGDSVASALVANGVHLMGRSFKYHRPRGLLGAGVEEPNALFNVRRGPGRTDPNQRATTIPLVDGLVVESQNRAPSLSRDAGAFNDLLSPFIPAGFYYKTFLWPRKFWHKVYEPRIRRMAGLGRAPEVADPDRYAQRWAHCETLIVGGGPAGLAAALAAAEAGGRVILCDEGEELGGALLADPHARIDGTSAWDWIARTRERLAASADIRLLERTTAFGYGIGNMIALAERLTDHLAPGAARGPRERQWLVRAARVVIATGSIERTLVFPNNDRPGVMLASAARSLLNRFGVAPGRRAVVAVNHDSGYQAAFELAEAGVTVSAIVDQRDTPPADLADRARSLGVEVIGGATPADTRGRLRVDEVTVRSPGGARRIKCDLLLMAGGWTPSVHLFSQSRGTVAWDEGIQAFVPGVSAQREESVGACRGGFALAQCLAEGWAAGGGAPGAAPRADAERRDMAGPLADPPAHAEGARAKAFVDFQNDVTAKDIRLAVREGFQSVEHIKRYTTNGMATDQGRTSNLNALAIAAQALGRTIPGTGLTTFRAPYTPTTFGTLAGYTAGALFDPERRTPLDARAVEAGAVFEPVGQWRRARYFPKPGEDMDAAVSRECRAGRSRVGMFDASTIGKIEVVGPDAAAFLDFLYVTTSSKLPVGRCRYSLLLREDGFISDDGVIARLGVDRFHVTTTSGGAANVLHVMEDFRQTEMPNLKVWLTSTTEQWAVIVVNGPRACDVIAPLVEGIDLAPGAFPHMGVREGSIAGAPTRLFRVSFTGELGYEVNVPAGCALEVWDAIAAAGKPHGLTLYGTEAMHVLRAEKGYIIVGQDTDGTVTPDDAGLGGMVAMKKADFIGKRSLMRPAMADPDRKQLLGLLTTDGRTILEEGAQIVDSAAPTRSLGHVSSSYPSDAVGRPIAMGLVRGGRARIGETLAVAMPGGAIPVTLVEPVFLDPEGTRLHV
jgi:sarcosine oxidase subunit alpha